MTMTSTTTVTMTSMMMMIMIMMIIVIIKTKMTKIINLLNHQSVILRFNCKIKEIQNLTVTMTSMMMTIMIMLIKNLCSPFSIVCIKICRNIVHSSQFNSQSDFIFFKNIFFKFIFYNLQNFKQKKPIKIIVPGLIPKQIGRRVFIAITVYCNKDPSSDFKNVIRSS